MGQIEHKLSKHGFKFIAKPRSQEEAHQKEHNTKIHNRQNSLSNKKANLRLKTKTNRYKMPQKRIIKDIDNFIQQ